MRTHVITGAASGIGLSSRRLLEADGHTVIGMIATLEGLRPLLTRSSAPPRGGRGEHVGGADAVIRGDSVLPFAGSSDAEV